jgi:hypothetical protein
MKTEEVLLGLKYTRSKFIEKNISLVENTSVISMLDEVIPKIEKLLFMEKEEKEVE